MFCKYCGNQIEEGQVCSCPQAIEEARAAINANNNFASDEASAATSQFAEQASQFGKQAGEKMNQLVTGTKGLINRLIPMFKNPIGEITELVETNNTSMAIQMITLQTVINTLIAIISLIQTRISLGEYAKYADIPYIKTILIAFIGTIILDFALAGVLHLGTNIIFKGKRTYGNMLILVACMTVPQSFTAVIGGIIGILISPIGTLITALGTILGLLFMICGYMNVVKLSENAKLYAMFVSYSIMLIVAGILVILLGQSILGSFSSLF